MPTPSEQDAMQFMNAVINKDVDDARRYLQKGVPTNIALVSDDNKFHHCSPLMIAAIQNDADMVHLLSAHGADVDWINKYGATALTYAAAENQPRA